MILGLDISTSTVGYTVLSDQKLEVIGYVKPSGSNVFEKVESSSEELIKTIGALSITKIYAEMPNVMFSKGLSSAQVIAAILRFNGAFLFTMYKHFNIIPIEVMASSARKRVIGIGRFKTDAKQEVIKWVQNDEPNIDWPKIPKGKHEGALLKESCDMADSYVIAKYGILDAKI